MSIETAISNLDLVHASGQLATFVVADMIFGVDVLHVQEVLCAQQMSPVPQAPAVIEGLINLRGQIVTAIDMRRRLLLPPRANGQSPMNMVIRTSDGTVSLLVDEIGDVLPIDASNYDRTPDNLDSAARELIRGVYKLKNQLLLVLDTERAIDVGSIPAPRNGRFEVPRSEEALPARRLSSPLSEGAVAEAMELQSLAKKGNKRTNTRSTSAAASKIRAGSA